MQLTWIPTSSRVKSPEAAAPRSACLDKICLVRVMRSVDGGSSSAWGFGFDIVIWIQVA